MDMSGWRTTKSTIQASQGGSWRTGAEPPSLEAVQKRVEEELDHQKSGSAGTNGARAGTLLSPECIDLDVSASTNEDLVAIAGALFHRAYGLSASKVSERLWRRERRQTTALGYGVALPHADICGLRRPAAAFLRCREPLDFAAPDRQPVSDVLILMVPRPASTRHFDLLAYYHSLLLNVLFRQKLGACADESAVWRLFERHECRWRL